MTKRLKCELCGRALPYRDFYTYKWQESYCSKVCCDLDKLCACEEEVDIAPDKETLLLMSIEFNTDDSVYKEEFIEEEDEILDY